MTIGYEEPKGLQSNWTRGDAFEGKLWLSGPPGWLRREDSKTELWYDARPKGKVWESGEEAARWFDVRLRIASIKPGGVAQVAELAKDSGKEVRTLGRVSYYSTVDDIADGGRKRFTRLVAVPGGDIRIVLTCSAAMIDDEHWRGALRTQLDQFCLGLVIRPEGQPKKTLRD